MSVFENQIDYYLEQYHRGFADDAFHGLLDLGSEVTDRLQKVFRQSTDPELRSFLLHAIWQSRQVSVIPILGEALLDPSPVVWKEALNGLVTLACPQAIIELRNAGKRRGDSEFYKWLKEAVEQAEHYSEEQVHKNGG